jgi:hypothetical protein
MDDDVLELVACMLELDVVVLELEEVVAVLEPVLTAMYAPPAIITTITIATIAITEFFKVIHVVSFLSHFSTQL